VENSPRFSEDPNLEGDGHHVFMVRQRLLGSINRRIKPKWTAPKAEIATAISKVIDDIMLHVWKAPSNPKTMFWSMPVCVCSRGTANKCRGCEGSIYFRLHRDETGTWKSFPEEVEAYLSLWLFELSPTEGSNFSSYPRRRKLGTSEPGLLDDLRR
jgi:hypothetical protein